MVSNRIILKFVYCWSISCELLLSSTFLDSPLSLTIEKKMNFEKQLLVTSELGAAATAEMIDVNFL